MNSLYKIVNLIFIVSTFYSVVLKQGVNGKQWVAVRADSNKFIYTLPFPNSVFKYKLRGKETGGLFTLFKADYLDDGPGQHMHTREDELFHIIDGNVQFFVDGKQFCGSTGDYVYVPRNVSQAIRVKNIDKRAKPVRIEILLTPSGLEDFLDEIEPLYYNGQNDTILQNNIAIKYGIINLDPVDWKELGCFPVTTSSSSRLLPFSSSVISFVKNLF